MDNHWSMGTTTVDIYISSPWVQNCTTVIVNGYQLYHIIGYVIFLWQIENSLMWLVKHCSDFNILKIKIATLFMFWNIG